MTHLSRAGRVYLADAGNQQQQLVLTRSYRSLASSFAAVSVLPVGWDFSLLHSTRNAESQSQAEETDSMHIDLREASLYLRTPKHNKNAVLLSLLSNTL